MYSEAAKLALIPYTIRFNGEPGTPSKINPVLDSYYVLLEIIILLNEDKKRISFNLSTSLVILSKVASGKRERKEWLRAGVETTTFCGVIGHF